jgi:hypothetical protein
MLHRRRRSLVFCTGVAFLQQAIIRCQRLTLIGLDLTVRRYRALQSAPPQTNDIVEGRRWPAAGVAVGLLRISTQ